MTSKAHGFERLVTDRCVLRRFSSDDMAALLEAMNSPDVMLWLGRAKEAGACEMREVINAEPTDSLVSFAVADKSTDKLLGHVWLSKKNGELWTLCYWIHPAHAGVGFATEAVAAGCKFAFESLGISQVRALIHPANPKSRRVVEKCGFSKNHRDAEMGFWIRSNPVLESVQSNLTGNSG